MKTVLLFLAGLVSLSLNAQSWDVNPDSAYASGYNTTSTLKADAYVRNNGNDTLNVAWDLVDDTVPASWDRYICDPVECYPPTTIYGTLKIAPGDSALMAGNFDPNGEVGMGEYHVLVYDPQDTVGPTVIRYFATATVSVEEEKRGFVVYPNPAGEVVKVEFKGHFMPHPITVYDVTGAKIKQQIAKSRNIDLNLSGLDTGLYFLQSGEFRGTILKE